MLVWIFFSYLHIVGNLLLVDHAITFINRPYVAGVLVEYEVSYPLLLHLWKGKDDSDFWQDVIFKRVPFYYSFYKRLGHSSNACYVTNLGPHMA